ncbi:MAG TPA: substrate-binding domain-containing protein [Roseiarcus sp.]|jgi:simple sugar transport system substrate-binding protein
MRKSVGFWAVRWPYSSPGTIWTRLELQGTVGSALAIERKKGFEAVISLFPQMKIVKTQSGTDGGKQVMEAFIKATDNLKGVCGVFAHNDNMQLGAIQAMKEAGLKPGKDFLMVSVDYVLAMKQALAAGDSNASARISTRLAVIASRRR